MKSSLTVFVLVASLFKSNLGIYEVHNNGAWYNFGYLFGLACILGGGGNRTPRRPPKNPISWTAQGFLFGLPTHRELRTWVGGYRR